MNERTAKEARLAELRQQLQNVEGSPTEVYSRIVGYYRSIRNWNAGKRHEYTKRKTYQLEKDSQNQEKSIHASAPMIPALESAVTPKSPRLAGENQKTGVAEAFLLFTREACPGCKPVKEYVQTNGLRATIVDVDTPAGLETARQYNVMATPTAIVLGKQGEEKLRAYTRSQLAGFFGPAASQSAVVQL